MSKLNFSYGGRKVHSTKEWRGLSVVQVEGPTFPGDLSDAAFVQKIEKKRAALSHPDRALVVGFSKKYPQFHSSEISSPSSDETVITYFFDHWKRFDIKRVFILRKDQPDPGIWAQFKAMTAEKN